MVDLVGRHDILFMYVAISLTVMVLFLMETLFNFRGHIINLVYFAWYTNLTLNDLMASQGKKISAIAPPKVAKYSMITILIYLLNLC